MLLIKSSKVYDTLKYIAQIVLPACAAAYLGLSEIWGLPNGEEVVGSIVVVDTLLGGLLHLSSTAYEKTGEKYDGEINVLENEQKKTFSLDLKGEPEELEGKDEVIFKVNKA